MTKDIDPWSPEIQVLRERVFQGKVNSPTLCAIFDRHSRTILRWKARGLPYVRIGNQDWFDLDQVRHWLEVPKSRAGRARPRGRPKSLHAAGRHRKIPRDPRASCGPDGDGWAPVDTSDAKVVVERGGLSAAADFQSQAR